MRRSLVLAALAATLSSHVHAESINIDFGSAAGSPSPSFPAAGSAGHWNMLTTGANERAPLLDLTGAPTDVLLEQGIPFGQVSADHPSTQRDVESLLDDYLDLHSVPHTFVIRNLDPGLYRLTVYTWAPDLPGAKTAVTVNGGEPALVGGAWPGGFVAGVTHSTHEVLVETGATVDLFTFGIGKGTLNGLQIELLEAGTSADLDGNGVVDGADLGLLLGAWETPGPGDLNGDGLVDGADLGLLLGAWTA